MVQFNLRIVFGHFFDTAAPKARNFQNIELSTMVTFLSRFMAISKAFLACRSTSGQVYFIISRPQNHHPGLFRRNRHRQLANDRRYPWMGKRTQKMLADRYKITAKLMTAASDRHSWLSTAKK